MVAPCFQNSGTSPAFRRFQAAMGISTVCFCVSSSPQGFPDEPSLTMPYARARARAPGRSDGGSPRVKVTPSPRPFLLCRASADLGCSCSETWSRALPVRSALSCWPGFRTQALVLRAPVGIRSLLNEPKGGVSLEKLEFLERGVYIFLWF